MACAPCNLFARNQNVVSWNDDRAPGWKAIAVRLTAEGNQMLDKRKEASSAPDHAVRSKDGTQARSTSVGARRLVTKGEHIVRVVDTAPVAKKNSAKLVAEKLGATPVGQSLVARHPCLETSVQTVQP